MFRRKPIGILHTHENLRPDRKQIAECPVMEEGREACHGVVVKY
jgi:hypothetical protein